MKKQRFSFRCAIKGVICAVCSEGHLRFHLVAAFYVLLFSFFYRLSTVQWTVILTLIGAVIAAELLNTAIENVCDLITTEKNEFVRAAKDISAGAVLVLALAAAVAAVLLFLDFDVISGIVRYFAGNIPMLVLLAFSAVFAAIFVWLGPRGIKKKLRRTKHKDQTGTD